jgi:hypothetical protein
MEHPATQGDFAAMQWVMGRALCAPACAHTHAHAHTHQNVYVHLQVMYKGMMRRIFIEAYVTGNYSSERALDLMGRVEQRLQVAPPYP